MAVGFLFPGGRRIGEGLALKQKRKPNSMKLLLGLESVYQSIDRSTDSPLGFPLVHWQRCLQPQKIRSKTQLSSTETLL